MFGLKKLIKSAMQQPEIKIVATQSFINSINDIKEKSLDQINDNRKDESDKLLIEAKNLIDKCLLQKNFNAIKLKEISDKLILSLKNNRNNAESYLKLAQVFYIAGNNKLAAKYLKIAREISPNLEGIDKLAEVISTEPIISKISSIKTSSVVIKNGSNIAKPEKIMIKRIENNILKS